MHGLTQRAMRALLAAALLGVAAPAAVGAPIGKGGALDAVAKQAAEGATMARDNRNRPPKVAELDEMLEVVKAQSEVADAGYAKLQSLERDAGEPLSGTGEEIIKALKAKVDAVETFHAHAKPRIEEAIGLSTKYGDDSALESRYRVTRLEADGQYGEEQYVSRDAVGRKAWADFNLAYPAVITAKQRALREQLEQAAQIRAAVIQQALGSANTDLMVVEYRKGKDLTDLLQLAQAKLDVVSRLDAGHEGIKRMRQTVTETRQKRLEEIKKGLEAYRFQPRHGAAPGNAAELEQRIKALLEKSPSGDYKSIRKVAVASAWIDVLHPLTGKLMYHQIDFHVANRYPQSEPGVIDVLYVTGKTSGANKAGFATYSVGSVGQMLEKNL